MRRAVAVGGALVVAVLLATAAGTLSASAGAASGAPPVKPPVFSGASTSGRPGVGRPFPAAVAAGLRPHDAGTGGSGFLSVFQEASSGTLDVSIGDTPAVSLSPGDFSYGVVAAGIYPITAASQGSTVATGTVTVGAGANVTAVVYLSNVDTPIITGFVNNLTSVPSGESRVVFRNTAANTGGLDIYVNGAKVATGLSNVPSAPTKATVVLSAGKLTIDAVPAGQTLGQPMAAPYPVEEIGVVLPGNLLNVFVVGDPQPSGPLPIGFLTNSNPLGTGYRLYASDGGVFDFGSAGFFGSTGGMHLNQPIVGAAPTSLGLGYRLVASDGGVFDFGDAQFYGSAGGMHLNEPVVGMASNRRDSGYWLVASDGGVFTYGQAAFYGSMGGTHLNQPIVGMAATPDGAGYWLVASDGGVFAFGDATFEGSTGGMHLNQPIVAIVPTVDGEGYWLVARDGGVFSFGDASFYGSMGGLHLNKPIVSAVGTPDSLGYWLVAGDGGVFAFGDATFEGSTGGMHLNAPIVAASSPGAALPD